MPARVCDAWCEPLFLYPYSLSCLFPIAICYCSLSPNPLAMWQTGDILSKYTFKYMKKIATLAALAVASITTVFAQGSTYVAGQAAATTVNATAINQFITLIVNVTNSLIPIAVTLAVLAFFWYLIQFIWHGKEEAETKKKTLAGMGWSVLALFVMVSIWGLIGFIGSVTGIGQGGRVPIPGTYAPTTP